MSDTCLNKENTLKMHQRRFIFKKFISLCVLRYILRSRFPFIISIFSTLINSPKQSR